MAASRKGVRTAPSVSLGSADAVLGALRQRYEAPAWALFGNVANATGFGANRWADAIAMSVWPSRGLMILGFEIKVTRSDLLRELKDPKKADEVGQYCDFWWVASGSAELAKPEELPPAWGLLAPVTTRAGVTMRVIKEAGRLKPKALDRSFVAAILRRAHETYDPDRLRRLMRDEIYQEVCTAAESSLAKQHDAQITNLRAQFEQARREADAARAQLRDVLDATYDPFELQRAIALLRKLGGGWNGAEPALVRAMAQIEPMIGAIAATRDGLRDTLELVRSLTEKDRPQS